MILDSRYPQAFSVLENSLSKTANPICVKWLLNTCCHAKPLCFTLVKTAEEKNVTKLTIHSRLMVVQTVNAQPTLQLLASIRTHVPFMQHSKLQKPKNPLQYLTARDWVTNLENIKREIEMRLTWLGMIMPAHVRTKPSHITRPRHKRTVLELKCRWKYYRFRKL